MKNTTTIRISTKTRDSLRAMACDRTMDDLLRDLPIREDYASGIQGIAADIKELKLRHNEVVVALQSLGPLTTNKIERLDVTEDAMRNLYENYSRTLLVLQTQVQFLLGNLENRYPGSIQILNNEVDSRMARWKELLKCGLDFIGALKKLQWEEDHEGE